MALAYIQTMCPKCGRELVACFCATTPHSIIDPTVIEVVPKEEFIRSVALDLEAFVREGHAYKEWVNILMHEFGIPHALACDLLDYVKERKGMIRTPQDTLLYV